MGFSKKDLGDVVWSSKTGRDPVFLTSRPKDIDYPQLLSIQTLDRRTTGATLFQMERRPFILFRASPSRNGVQANQYRCVWDSTRVKYSPNPVPVRFCGMTRLVPFWATIPSSCARRLFPQRSTPYV